MEKTKTNHLVSSLKQTINKYASQKKSLQSYSGSDGYEHSDWITRRRAVWYTDCQMREASNTKRRICRMCCHGYDGWSTVHSIVSFSRGSHTFNTTVMPTQQETSTFCEFPNDSFWDLYNIHLAKFRFSALIGINLDTTPHEHAASGGNARRLSPCAILRVQVIVVRETDAATARQSDRQFWRYRAGRTSVAYCGMVGQRVECYCCRSETEAAFTLANRLAGRKSYKWGQIIETSW
jgi:hypothetical protein